MLFELKQRELIFFTYTALKTTAMTDVITVVGDIIGIFVLLLFISIWHFQGMGAGNTIEPIKSALRKVIVNIIKRLYYKEMDSVTSLLDKWYWFGLTSPDTIWNEMGKTFKFLNNNTKFKRWKGTWPAKYKRIWSTKTKKYSSIRIIPNFLINDYWKYNINQCAHDRHSVTEINENTWFSKYGIRGCYI